MCKFTESQQEGWDQTYVFMELEHSSRHFQCLALILSYINQGSWGRPRHLYTCLDWSANLSIENAINLNKHLGGSVLKMVGGI